MNKTMAVGAGLLAFGVLVGAVHPGHWMAFASGGLGLFICISEAKRVMHAEKIARFRRSGLPDSLFEKWKEQYSQMKAERLPDSFLRDWERLESERIERFRCKTTSTMSSD